MMDTKDHAEHMNAVLEAYYKQVGFHHSENIIADMYTSQEKEGRNYPESLHCWFADYLKRHKAKEKIKQIEKNSIWKQLRVSSIIIVVVLSLSFATLSVDAFRSRLLNLIMEVTSRYSILFIHGQSAAENNAFALLDGRYVLTRIPAGFELGDIEDTPLFKSMRYTSKKGQYIIFTQSYFGSGTMIDSEDATIQKVYLYDAEATLFKKEEMMILYWYNEEFNFMIQTNLNQAELMRLAKSLKKER